MVVKARYPAMPAMGHEERFLRPMLSGRCRFGQETFAGTHGNGEDAPRTDLGARTTLAGVSAPAEKTGC